MTDEKIKSLEEKIDKLQKQLDKLQESSFLQFDEFTKYICEHSRDIGDLYHYTLPMYKKLFPDYVQTKQQLDSILNRDSSRKIDGSDKKSS